jgi:hypothetical protein
MSNPNCLAFRDDLLKDALARQGGRAMLEYLHVKIEVSREGPRSLRRAGATQPVRLHADGDSREGQRHPWSGAFPARPYS